MREYIQYLEIIGGYVDQEEKLWFCPLKLNSLFSYDLNTGELSWKGRIPGEPIFKQALYRNCVRCNNKVYLVPYTASEIAIYDINTKEIKKLKVEDYGVKNNRYSCAAVYGNMIFMFGDKTPCTLIINTDTDEVSYFEKMHNELDSIKNKDIGFYISRSLIIEENLCYFIGAEANVLVIFNMDTMEYEFVPLGESEGSYNNLYKMNDDIYLIPGRNNRFAVWNIKNKTLNEIGEKVEGSAQYFATYECNKKVYALADNADHNICISQGENGYLHNREEINSFADHSFCSDKLEEVKFKYSYAYSDEKRVLFFCRMNRKLYQIDKTLGTKKQEYIFLNSEIRKQISSTVYGANAFGVGEDVLKENKIYDLEAFIKIDS